MKTGRQRSWRSSWPTSAIATRKMMGQLCLRKRFSQRRSRPRPPPAIRTRQRRRCPGHPQTHQPQPTAKLPPHRAAMHLSTASSRLVAAKLACATATAPASVMPSVTAGMGCAWAGTIGVVPSSWASRLLLGLRTQRGSVQHPAQMKKPPICGHAHAVCVTVGRRQYPQQRVGRTLSSRA